MPSFLVFAIAAFLVVFPLFFAMSIVGSFTKEGGSLILPAILVSLVIGAISIRIGFWMLKDLSAEPVLSIFSWQIDMPTIESNQTFVLPMLGLIDMVGGGLMAVGGTFAAVVARRKAKAQ